MQNAAQAEQALQGDSPTDGQTDRMGTESAQPLDNQLRYTQFKFEG